MASSLNPSLARSPFEQASPSQYATHLKAQFQRAQESARSFVSFVSEEHLTVETFRAFWRHEERAYLTLRAIGQSLDVDLPGTARTVAEGLAFTAEMDLPEFQAGDAAHLFATIDSIAPDDVGVGDGRPAAELFQYAAEARSALLGHVLSVVSQRYPAPTFNNLIEANQWTRAFAALLEEAEEVIVGTQRLLYDEATAAQSYLDTLRNHFELLDEQARAAAVIVRLDWQGLIQRSEKQILDLLDQRHERLGALAFGEMRETRESGLLEVIAQQTVRHAPVLGTLLFTLAGGATILSPTVQDALPSLPDLRASTSRFPVLARHADRTTSEAGRRAHDEVARFFAQQPRPRGRHTLTIENSGTLSRVLDELSRFGYVRREVLGLFNLNSVNDLAGPMTMDLRWSQGGRPLLLPPYEPVQTSAPTLVERHTTQPGAPLALISERFGFSEDELLAANPDLAPDAVRAGQVIELPAAGWTQRSRDAGATLAWGVSLEQIARELNLSVATLADLNDIANPDSWLYEGQRLLLPAAPAPVAPEPESAAPAPIPAPLRFEGEAKSVSSLVVHHARAGETLDALAERYHVTLATLLEDNRLDSDALEPGQMLLVRVPGRVVGVAAPTGLSTGAAGVRSSGSFPTVGVANRVPVAVAPQPGDGAALVARYGPQLFPSIDAMPEDARLYFTGTVQEVADFFNVRPGDIIGILQAENNNAGLRLHQPATSSAGARGVAQVVARTWNGWANPETERHTTSLLSIEQHGGLGFDWSAREAWRAWKDGTADESVLAATNADPMVFENSVAAVARHLVHWGLTRDRAEIDPTGFQSRLADAIAVYNSGRPLSESADWVQSSANRKTTGDYVREAMTVAEATPISIVTPASSEPLREAYRAQILSRFGIRLSEQEVTQAVDGSPVALAVTSGQMSVEAGTDRLLSEALQHYIVEGQAARSAGRPLPWPFIYDQQSALVQQLAIRYLGQPLAPWEVDRLVAETGGDLDAIRRSVANRGDARLFAATMRELDTTLKRSERGRSVSPEEAVALVQPAIAGFNPHTMSDEAIEQAMDGIRRAIHALPEYREVNGLVAFAAAPLDPMPRLIKGFGVPVNYQRGGHHTGIDLANPRVNGQEPPIYAVSDGTVAHVGPLYCATPNACRGGNSIVIDHGGNVYSIYSHNSAASVQAGQRVRAGQEIGRQGDEGYSFGSHLHFEVHTGAPYSGDWENPFHGGQFEDPAKWLANLLT